MSTDFMIADMRDRDKRAHHDMARVTGRYITDSAEF